MKKLILFLLLSPLVIYSQSSQESKPNIIFFLADDLGYGEVGYQGQKIIKTPSIDQLSKEGMVFTQHYSGSPVCAPARYIFLTGKHAGHAYIRSNDEWRERGETNNYLKAAQDPYLEGQRPIPPETVTVAKLLKEAGYTTGLFGKWGLGGPATDGIPTNHGFDQFYGYNCQRQAHNLYPPHLWENETKIKLNNTPLSAHVRLTDQEDPDQAASYAKYTMTDYAPALIHDKAIDFLKQSGDQPFFLYYASPLPHLPLQAPTEEIESYKKVIDEKAPYNGKKGYYPNQYPRATYAAMITYLDTQLGELISVLKETGKYDNTIIIVTSDNGPTYDVGGMDPDYFASSGPFSNGYGRTKGFVYEGGLRVPTIVSWKGKILSGSTNDHISAFYDWLPTLCDLGGAKAPKEIDGISFKNTLLGKDQEQHEYLYWEFPSYKGQQAVRMGKWKAVRKNIFEGNLHLELYDLEKDPKELNDLSKTHPEVVKKMEAILKKEHTQAENKKFRFPQLGDQS